MLYSGFNISAEDPAQTNLKSWKEDFSNPISLENWRTYGFLAPTANSKSPIGTSAKKRGTQPDWWEVEDGALCGRYFPEEKHPSGIRRKVDLIDFKFRCRFKFDKNGKIGFAVSGKNPVLERNFNVGGFYMDPNLIYVWDNDVKFPKDSPEALEMKKKKQWNRKYLVVERKKLQTPPDVWHNLRVEMKGKLMSIYLNDKFIMQYTTICGDGTKTEIGLYAAGKGKSIAINRYDDISIEPL